MEEFCQIIFLSTMIFVAPITAGFWLSWYISASQIKSLAIVPQRQWLYWVPLLCLGGAVRFAGGWVWLDSFFLVIFLAIAAFGLQLVTSIANLLNMGAIAEGIERRNPAVIWAVCGAWIGITACIAPVRMGTGDVTHTTLMGSLFLAVGVFMGLWLLFSALTRNPVAIALDRDIPSGLRLAGLLIAWGLVIGNALADNWASPKQAIAHFVHQAWIVLVLLGIAIVFEHKLQPSKQQPFPSIKEAGWLPATIYLAIAAFWLLFPMLEQ